MQYGVTINHCQYKSRETLRACGVEIKHEIIYYTNTDVTSYNFLYNFLN